MGLEQDIALLMRVRMFQGFSPEQLRLLAFGSERTHQAVETMLFHEGDEADGGFVVFRGQVDLTLQRGSRFLLVDSIFEAGLVGELAMVTATRRSTDAMARKDTEVLFIPRRLFHRMLNEFPDTAQMLHQRIVQSVRGLTAQVSAVNEKLRQSQGLSIFSTGDASPAHNGSDEDR